MPGAGRRGRTCGTGHRDHRLRNGARALVVERHPGTSIYPRATGVHLRTVELLARLGPAPRGPRSRRCGFARCGRCRRRCARPPAAAGLSDRPAGGARGQPGPSGLLPAGPPRAGAAGAPAGVGRRGPVRGRTADLVDDGAGITATLRDRATCVESIVRARFVVGADGTRSASGARWESGRSGSGSAASSSTRFHGGPGRLLGDRRFGPYVITHPDAAGIIIRVSDDRWSTPGSGFPSAGSRRRTSPRNAAPSSSAPRSGTRGRGAAADPHAVHHGRRGGGHLPRGQRLPGR